MKRWSRQEDDVLWEYYPTEGAVKCANRISRSINAIRKRVDSIGLSGAVRGKRKDWTSDEDEIIRLLYADSIDKTCAVLFDRSRSAVSARANCLGVYNRNRPYKWDKEDWEKLVAVYPSATVEDLEDAFPGLNGHAIREYARKRGLRCEVCHQRKGDIKSLLEETNEAYYWAGFIAADGHITKTGQVVVVAKGSDGGHLKKLAKFMITEVRVPYLNSVGEIPKHRRNMVRVAVSDKVLGRKFAEKFDFSTRKTYEPPNPRIIGTWKREQAVSFLAGFLDGDGCARKSGAFQIEIYLLWQFFLEFMFRHVGICSDVRQNARKYATSYISFEDGREVFSEVLKSNIPIMERKWLIVTRKLKEKNNEGNTA